MTILLDPTIWSWLALLLVFAVVASGAAKHLYPFLAQNEPAPGATILIVEGWMSRHQFDQAIAIAKAKEYQHIITSGGPLDARDQSAGLSTFADRAASYFKRQGMRVTPVGAPATAHGRTYLSAMMVRNWVLKENLAPSAIDVFSSGAHSRRTKMLYQAAFGPAVRVGILAGRPNDIYDVKWWRTRNGTKTVLKETLAVLCTKCGYRPRLGSNTDSGVKAVPTANMVLPPTATRRALHAIAIFEFLKGLAALAVVVGVIDLMHRDVRRMAMALIGRFGLDQDSRYPSLLLHYAELVPRANVELMLLLGVAYTGLRWLEAFGLWKDRSWGEWLAAISGGIYIPFEAIHLMHRSTAINAAVLSLNILMVGFLLYQLRRRKADVYSQSNH